ncbi:MAG: polysaccharide biosynthesis tyrosine autokinase [Candidatus Binatus sp.]|uniref:GumC family protein n=1 Tax=Candidatus Binatus sp. TaxID=2811406 RepID=UPI003C791915
MTQPSPYFIRRTGHLEEPLRGAPFGPGNFDEEEGRIDLLGYWHVVRKRLALVIGVVFAAMVLTVIYAYMQTPLYTAQATILLKPGSPQIMDGKDASQDQDVMEDSDMYDNFQKTQYEILKSRSLAAYVIRAENLEHNPAFVGPPPQPGLISSALSSVSQWLNHTNGRKAPPQPADQTVRNGVPPGLISAYLGGLRISPIVDTELVAIEYVSSDRALAAKLANAHAHGYIRLGIELRSQSNEEAENFLKERLGELKDSLEKSEVALNDYRRAKGIIPGLMSLDGKETVVLDRVTELGKDLTTAQVERIGLEAQMQLINSRKYDSMPVVMGDTGVQAVQTDLNSVDADYASMGKKFKPDYPPMLQLAAKRQELQERLDAEISRVIAGIQGSYQAASDKEKKLQAEMDKERQQALGLNDAAVEYAILQREVDTNRELYESVLERMKGIGLAAESQTSNIIIVDPAETPGAPSSPRKLSMTLRNSALALVAVIGLVFGLEYLDTTLKTPEQVERYLRVPNIGAIPSFANLRLKAKAAALPPEENGIKKIGYGRELLGVANPYSLVGEAYRSFRTALMLSRAGAPPKTILFTSAHSSEGKTVSATNTAAMFAQTGARVLLIDGDLRKPRCHRVLALENSSGLTEVLTGTCEVQDVIRTTIVDGLSFMSAGSLPPNPTELLGSERMSQVLAMVAHQHDVVIIDSPPVMPVSDALLLATVVDGVVLVVNSLKTSKHHVKMAAAKLEYARAKIFGVLLNEIDLKHPNYGHYSHYYNHYTRPDPDFEMPFKDSGDPDNA